MANRVCTASGAHKLPSAQIQLMPNSTNLQDGSALMCDFGSVQDAFTDIGQATSTCLAFETHQQTTLRTRPEAKPHETVWRWYPCLQTEAALSPEDHVHALSQAVSSPHVWKFWMWIPMPPDWSSSEPWRRCATPPPRRTIIAGFATQYISIMLPSQKQKEKKSWIRKQGKEGLASVPSRLTSCKF